MGLILIAMLAGVLYMRLGIGAWPTALISVAGGALYFTTTRPDRPSPPLRKEEGKEATYYRGGTPPH